MLILGVQDGAKLGQVGVQMEAVGEFEAIIRFQRRSWRDSSAIFGPNVARMPDAVLGMPVPGPPGPGESGSGPRALPSTPTPLPGYM